MKLQDYPIHFEDIVTKNKLRKKDLTVETIKVPTKKKATSKPKNTLSILTYLNWKQFGLAVRIEDGIKITVLWFETHIKLSKQ